MTYAEVPAQDVSFTHTRSRDAYLPDWVRHVRSLKLFGVETHAFFSVPSATQTIVALISFDEHADPEAVTSEYMQSDVFKEDMHGFDGAQIEGVDTLLLEPGEGSPLT